MPTVTIGATTYDVYADVDTADEYFNASIQFDDWDGLTPDEKARALVSSTRLIDRQSWKGTKTDPLQVLEFPRDGVVDCSGEAVSSATTLEVAAEASMILALDLASGSSAQTAVTTEDLTKSLKAGSVSIEKFRGDSSVTAARFSLPVMELIGCYFAGSVAGLAGSLAYGTDGVSPDEDFGFTQGF